MIAAEQARAISHEGFDAAYDDRAHRHGELAIAAACYALHASGQHTIIVDEFGGEIDVAESKWPFIGGYNPKTPLRDLVRAGHLIVAEIERRLRAGEQHA